MAAECPVIECELSDGVVVLILNRPEKRNAFNTAMYDALSDSFEAHAKSNSTTRVLVLAGAGPCFSGGMDLHDVFSKQQRAARRFMLAFVHCPLPIVVAAHGQCVGIGTTLLMHADMVLCADDAVFTTPFRVIGIPPEFASSVLFPRRLGKKMAVHLLYAGGSATADDFRFAGVAEDVPSGSGGKRVREIAIRRAQELSRGAPTDDEWEGVLVAKEMVQSQTRGEILRAIQGEFEEIRRAYRHGRPQRLIAERLASMNKRRGKL